MTSLEMTKHIEFYWSEHFYSSVSWFIIILESFFQLMAYFIQWLNRKNFSLLLHMLGVNVLTIHTQGSNYNNYLEKGIPSELFILLFSSVCLSELCKTNRQKKLFYSTRTNLLRKHDINVEKKHFWTYLECFSKEIPR